MWVAVAVLLAAALTATAPDELSRPGLRTSALASASNVTLWPASEWHVTHGPAPECVLCENFGPVVSLMPAWQARQRESGTSAVPWGKRGLLEKWSHSSLSSLGLWAIWAMNPESIWQSTHCAWP